MVLLSGFGRLAAMNLLHYGLQRSGTNYLEALLRRKYRVRFLNRNEDRSSPLQKHFRLYDEKDIVPEPRYRNDVVVGSYEDFARLFEVVPDYCLVISKDPYSWYSSYKAWAKRCDWPAVDHHYIEEYNLFYGKWLELSRKTDAVVHVRYVDLLRDPGAELSRLEARMRLRKRPLARWLSNRVGRVEQSARFTDEAREDFLDEGYLGQYGKEELEALNGRLDREVVALLGYETRE